MNTGDDLGLDNLKKVENGSDLSGMKPDPRAKADVRTQMEIDQVAREAGYGASRNQPSHEASSEPEMTASERRAQTNAEKNPHRVGRSIQLNKKVRSQFAERFGQLCDDQNWKGSQAMEYAVDALKEIALDPGHPFWNTRKFKGRD